MTRIMDALRQAEADQQLQAPGFLRPALDRAQPEVAKADSETEELVELRNLLFGSMLGDVERAVERVEASLESELKRVREAFVACEQRIDVRLVELDRQRGQSQGELRERILAESKQLNESMDQQAQRIRQLIDQGIGELRDTKMDRTEFSSTLTSAAERLAQGPKKG